MPISYLMATRKRYLKWGAIFLLGAIAATWIFSQNQDQLTMSGVTTVGPDELNKMWESTNSAESTKTPKELIKVKGQGDELTVGSDIKVVNLALTATPVPSASPPMQTTPIRFVRIPKTPREIEGVFAYIRVPSKLVRIEVHSIESFLSLEKLSRELRKESHKSLAVDSAVQVSPRGRGACLTQKSDLEFGVIEADEPTADSEPSGASANQKPECVFLGRVLNVYDFKDADKNSHNPNKILFTSNPYSSIASEVLRRAHDHIFGPLDKR